MESFKKAIIFDAGVLITFSMNGILGKIKDLKNKSIATSYPKSTKKFFSEKKIPVKIVTISGSVEITPSLGVADAIVDLTSTGSTLALNDLKILAKIYNSESVLIANKDSLINGKKDILEKLIIRFKSVLSAKNYKYILMTAPKKKLSKIIKIIPNLKFNYLPSPNNIISIQSVIKEDVFWETINKLKKYQASQIIILPIEKMII